MDGEVRVLINGKLIGNASGFQQPIDILTATSKDLFVAGDNTLDLVFQSDGGGDGLDIRATVLYFSSNFFIRGDCNGDGVPVTVTDAIHLLEYNFLGERDLPCVAACDADGDGQIVSQVSDAILMLRRIKSNRR